MPTRSRETDFISLSIYRQWLGSVVAVSQQVMTEEDVRSDCSN